MDKKQRADGRSFDELRPIKITPDCLDFAEGSALIEVGRTRVMAAATLEDKVPAFIKNTGSGWVTAEYAMLPRSTEKRTQRERMQGGRSQEIQRLIGRSLRSVTDLPLLGERQVIIDCVVLQADGGTRVASISAACIALALCLKRMLDLRLISRMPLKHLVAAVSVGFVDGELLLDLDYGEDSSAELDMNIVQTDRGQLVEVQASAEKAPFSRKTLAGLMQLGDKGVTEIIQKQREVLIKKSRLFMAYGD
ncbi:MAG: ribonuclease PH [Candidatus Aminicenantes bacterium RBG_13_62_12]|nr:MAG: ribonuclease PH [Candidatus Aminicenantes bacterium RBG_13_62_12]